MKTFEVKTLYSHVEDCILCRDTYLDNNHIALSVYSLSEGPFADITVNLSFTDTLPENCSFVDTNNFPEAEALIARLGIGRPLGKTAISGFCSYPLYEFDTEAVDSYVRATEESEDEYDW